MFYQDDVVKQVDVVSTNGNFGILANHVPCIAVLKPGVVKVFESDKTVSYFGEISGDTHVRCVIIYNASE